jgi:hypothetical protein
LTAPLTPADCDLRDFPRMMIDIPRLRGSDFDATPDDGGWRAGFNLWMTSWHGDPAGSLTDEEASLAKAAGLHRDLRTWKKVRTVALRGWVKCDDGKLYHPVVAEVALEAWLEKLQQRLSSGAGNAKRWGTVFDPTPIEAAMAHAVALLTNLDPQSKALAKHARRGKKPVPPDSEDDPGGTKKPSDRDTGNVPARSQGTGTGNQERDSDESSLSDARAPAIEELIPEGFPDAAAIAEAEAMVASSRKPLNVAEQVARFQTQARSKKRRLADWPAAWLGWIEIELAKLPAPEPTGEVVPMRTFPGPTALRAAVLKAVKGDEAWMRSYFDQCEYDDAIDAVIPKNHVAAKAIRSKASATLTEFGAHLAEPTGRAAA